MGATFRIFFSFPWLFAITLSAIIYLVLPDLFPKYSCKVVSERQTGEGQEILYADLDSDGKSEMLVKGVNHTAPSVEVRTGGYLLKAVWNLQDRWAYQSPLLVGDYDGDSLKEMYGFTQRDDSLFIHASEILAAGAGTIIEELFVCTVRPNNQRVDYRIIAGKVTDIDHDGAGEVVFAVNAGYTLQPRRVYALEVDDQYLVEGPVMAANIKDLLFADLDGDGFDEVIVENLATANYGDNTGVPFSDHYSWLMVLGRDLQFFFEPVGYFGQTSFLQVLPIQLDSGVHLLGALRSANVQLPDNNILVYNTRGKVLIQRSMPGEQAHYMRPFSLTVGEESHVYIELGRSRSIYRVYDNLDISKVAEYPFKASQSFVLDADADGREEVLFLDVTGGVWIYRAGFSGSVQVNLGNEALRWPIHAQTIDGADAGEEIHMQIGRRAYTMKYGINPKRWLQYALFIPLFGMVLFVVQAGMYFQRIRDTREERNRKEIRQWQTKHTLAQLDPHFIMNALNAIGAVIRKESSDDAHQYIVRFAGLIRSALEHADDVMWTLEEELRFTELYVKLQQLRFKGLFEYTFDVDPQTDVHMPFPKMLIQHFAENAVKHGLQPGKGGGLLSVTVHSTGSATEIRIRDNGIGREAAGNLDPDSSTGKGMQLTESLVALFQDHTGKQVVVDVRDVVDDRQNIAGTEVTIHVGSKRMQGHG